MQGKVAPLVMTSAKSGRLIVLACGLICMKSERVLLLRSDGMAFRVLASASQSSQVSCEPYSVG